jgi:hypothetical protein
VPCLISRSIDFPSSSRVTFMTNGNPPPAELMLERLTRIHADISDVTRDVRDLKAASSVQLTTIGALVRGKARGDERFARLDLPDAE